MRGPGAQHREDNDDGQVAFLVIGYTLLSLLLLTVVMAASSIYLEHKKLLAVADGAAVAAAGSFTLASEPSAAGPPATILTSEGVRGAADSYLSTTGAAGRLSSLMVAPETGAPDGRTARVALTATAHPPIINFLVPDGIRITVVAEARASLVR